MNNLQTLHKTSDIIEFYEAARDAFLWDETLRAESKCVDFTHFIHWYARRKDVLVSRSLAVSMALCSYEYDISNVEIDHASWQGPTIELVKYFEARDLALRAENFDRAQRDTYFMLIMRALGFCFDKIEYSPEHGQEIIFILLYGQSRPFMSL